MHKSRFYGLNISYYSILAVQNLFELKLFVDFVENNKQVFLPLFFKNCLRK